MSDMTYKIHYVSVYDATIDKTRGLIVNPCLKTNNACLNKYARILHGGSIITPVFPLNTKIVYENCERVY